MANRSGGQVFIEEWKGAEKLNIPGGNIPPSEPWQMPARANIGYALESIPAEITVVWTMRGEEKKRSQVIRLKDFVPKSVTGATEFTIGADGVWLAEFVKFEDKDESSP